jgi:protein deglycase
MKKVVVVIAPGFEEIETITCVDILRRSGARLTMAGIENGIMEGSRGVNILADCSLDEVDPSEFDMIVLPGGQPGTTHLQNDPRVIRMVCAMNSSGKTIAAICAAPLVLQTAGILKGRRVTSHPSVRDQLNDVEYSENRVEVDGHIVTSQSPGTAMEFAMKLIEILFGTDRVAIVNKGVIANIQ